MPSTKKTKSFSKLLEDRVWFSRIFLIIGGVSILALGVVNIIKGNENYDPFYWRVTHALFCITLFTSTFINSYLKKHAHYLLYASILGATTWMCLMLYHNNFFERYVSSAYVLFAVMSFLFHNKKLVVYYLITANIGVWLAYIYQTETNPTANSFIVFFIIVSFASYLINSFLITSRLKLGDTNRMLSTLLQHTEESFLLIDSNFHIVKFNDSLADLMKEFTSKNISENQNLMAICPYTILDFFIANATQSLENVKTRHEIELNGEWYDFKFLPVLNENLKKVKYISITGVNFTERKKAELDLRKAKELAEAANKAKQEFLSVMSHEIRTPLNAVIGNSYLLETTNPTEEQTKLIKTLRFSSENLHSLINDILDFTKIESGKIELEKAEFNITELCENIHSSFEYQFFDKQLKFILKIDPKIQALVIGDKVRLSQILINLIGNALKFTSIGSVSVNIQQIEYNENKQKIRFEIADTGMGISLENQEKVFEDFTQARSDTTRKFGGTGLGLTITKRLIELQGGKIKLESEIEIGSSFSFELEYEVAELNTQKAKIPTKEFTESLSAKTIMVVDDNIINQQMAKSFLEIWKCNVLVASNGQECIDRLANEQIDCILMDLQMPILDGFETTTFIRNMPSPKNQTPIIALTASALIEVQEQVFNAQMNDYLSKPFTPQVLFSKLENILSM